MRSGPWVTTTFSQYDQEARAFALGLLAVARGAGARDFRPCVSVMAHNMPRWHFASLGALMANHLSAGIYLTNGPGATRYVLAHSRSTVCVVGTKKELDTVLAACALPEGGEGEGGALHVSHVVVMDPTWSAAGGSAGGSGAGGPTVLDWDAFVDLGKSVSLAELEASMGAQEPGTPCVLIYTSGTTSHPKAVMLSHDNLTWTSEAILKRVNEDTPTGPGSGYTFGSDEVYISYLPLSHIAAQILDIYIPLAIAAEVCFARPDALRGTLGVECGGGILALGVYL
jgi:long-chain-fatty-acid--CoA ligase ACSBG